MSKEKQIEEMAKEMCLDCAKDSPCSLARVGGMCNSVWKQATALYNAGYRKQREGEWTKKEKMYGKVSSEAVCSNCGRDVVYQVIDNKWAFENFCPHCGLKMKGVE